MTEIQRCPTCNAFDCVRELLPRNGRKARKHRRSGRTARMAALTGKMHMWECSRCVRGWFTFDAPTAT